VIIVLYTIHLQKATLLTRVLDVFAHVLQLAVIELSVFDYMLLKQLVLLHVRGRKVQRLRYLAVQSANVVLQRVDAVPHSIYKLDDDDDYDDGDNDDDG